MRNIHEQIGSNRLRNDLKAREVPRVFWRFLRWTLMCMARREFGVRFPSVRKSILRMTPRPILFIHGQNDSYLPVDQSRLLYTLAGQPKWFWIAPDARHNQAVIRHPEQYEQRTTTFFLRHLDASAGRLPAGHPAAAAEETALPTPEPALRSS